MNSNDWNKLHPERMYEAQVRYRELHRDELVRKQQIWRESHPGYVRQKSREYNERHPHRQPNRKYTILQQRAWHLIGNSNCLIGSECEFCGTTENLIGHHPDYDYPDIVVTCCQSCHANVHYGRTPKQ